MRCAVCGGRISGSYYQSSDGQRWCLTHKGLPACIWCGIPTARTPSCDKCRGSAIETTDAATQSIHRVGAAMAKRGFSIRRHLRVQIKPRSEFEKIEWLGWGAHQLGVTHYTRTAGGPPRDLTIALVQGMPRVLFEACFAHEYGHAILAESREAQPSWRDEGFAECVSYAYLTENESSVEAQKRATAIKANPDPLYGDGFRRVHVAVRRFGLPTVAQALLAARPGDVGLTTRL